MIHLRKAQLDNPPNYFNMFFFCAKNIVFLFAVHKLFWLIQQNINSQKR